ncbi:UNVERIFIED_CONTAM: hypothetical protein Slati_3812600 [Sesamum latifolium]|uniref:Uncharacterized protein n=1 Tax=Sesamum latifolium TaxID=2727402 RepID=A0AAW2U5L7_9LAMI
MGQVLESGSEFVLLSPRATNSVQALILNSSIPLFMKRGGGDGSGAASAAAVAVADTGSTSAGASWNWPHVSQQASV